MLCSIYNSISDSSRYNIRNSKSSSSSNNNTPYNNNNDNNKIPSDGQRDRRVVFAGASKDQGGRQMQMVRRSGMG